MSGPKTIALPDGTDEEFIHFEIVSEKWFVYEIEDGSILRSKFVLLEVVAIGEPDEQGHRLTKMGTQTINVIFSPLELRGPPGRKWEVSELEEFKTETNLKFSQIKDGGLNEYKLEKSNIQVDYRVNKIDKTSKYTANGMPAYIIRLKTTIIGTSSEES